MSIRHAKDIWHDMCGRSITGYSCVPGGKRKYSDSRVGEIRQIGYSRTGESLSARDESTFHTQKRRVNIMVRLL